MKRVFAVFLCAASVCLFALCAYFGVRAGFPRPYREVSTGKCGLLAYAVAKAESGFREDAVSRAGAVGVMQLKPSTARFICGREGIGYEESRLTEGGYNFLLGCRYLDYLLERFGETEALAAYNAGEGVVSEWLRDGSCSADGAHLLRIPYPETAAYVKKVLRFRKIYEFFY